MAVNVIFILDKSRTDYHIDNNLNINMIYLKS